MEKHEDEHVGKNHPGEVDGNGNAGVEVVGYEDDEMGILMNDDGDERWNGDVVWKTTWSGVP